MTEITREMLEVRVCDNAKELKAFLKAGWRFVKSSGDGRALLFTVARLKRKKSDFPKYVSVYDT